MAAAHPKPASAVRTPCASANNPRASLRLLHQRPDGSDHHGRFKRFAQDGVAAGARGLPLRPASRAVPRSGSRARGGGIGLDVAAQIEAAGAGQERVGDHQIRIDIGQAQPARSSPSATLDDFEAFFAQNPLAHALRVRAVVRQQDMLIGWCADFTALFFLLFFLRCWCRRADWRSPARLRIAAAGWRASGCVSSAEFRRPAPPSHRP